MQTESSLRLSQSSHHRLTFDLKKVVTLWILVIGVIAVLLWGFFSFPKKLSSCPVFSYSYKTNQKRGVQRWSKDLPSWLEQIKSELLHSFLTCKFMVHCQRDLQIPRCNSCCVQRPD
ncbi:similar to CD69 antigen (p60, early T-cell activation antigen) (predicted) [Rattus norvegicus]|uniref:Similar to CD69 antigen (P60, early T-cell activation antigen) (Predicted) n=1 Tax=Rattus norvegicus TaxID=10116 RepID=A6IM39_RAT|nr:similar to CD69 antigen (p60, early T-cell activation antigen) (predicted) [Rattus norvegicus]